MGGEARITYALLPSVDNESAPRLTANAEELNRFVVRIKLLHPERRLSMISGHGRHHAFDVDSVQRLIACISLLQLQLHAAFSHLVCQD